MTDTTPDNPVWTVRVGWTSSRPVRPDEHTAELVLAADTETEAHLLAALWTLASPDTVMPTSTLTLGVAI